MKRRIRFVLCCMMMLMMMGCHKSIGSFQEGTIDLSSVIEQINEKSIDGDWEYPIVNQTAWDGVLIQDTYGLDMTKVQSSYVVSSIVTAQLGELAFFKTEEAYDDIVKEAGNRRISSIKETWKDTLLEGDAILDEAKMGRIGEYYYLIIGRDAQKVVNYIQSL